MTVMRPCCTSTSNDRHDADCSRLLSAALRLRTYYVPHREIADGLECISFPFPTEDGRIGVMVRDKNDPTTMRQVLIPESDWTHGNSRCNCESAICAAACGHPHSCHKTNVVQVQAFGMLQTLCRDCADYAVRRYRSEVMILAAGGVR